MWQRERGLEEPASSAAVQSGLEKNKMSRGRQMGSYAKSGNKSTSILSAAEVEEFRQRNYLGESSHHISTSLLCSSYCSSSSRIDWAESRTFVGCHRPQEPVTWAPASLLILDSLASRQWGKAVSVRGWPSSHCKQVVSAEPKQTENSWNKLWKTSILYLRKINFLDMSQGSDIVPAT